ncbi:hypothetical protein F5148DRAFT_1147246 [Russula earlei]|uniref:Uncharacterized protein n=1 Tax=Russula earlei TaxID=71964 RepID=A0ACC0UGL3_9AGAM|nr:hypothetical protein F5148DRAFT_1147246 [Russula earlei]
MAKSGAMFGLCFATGGSKGRKGLAARDLCSWRLARSGREEERLWGHLFLLQTPPQCMNLTNEFLLPFADMCELDLTHQSQRKLSSAGIDRVMILSWRTYPCDPKGRQLHNSTYEITHDSATVTGHGARGWFMKSTRAHVESREASCAADKRSFRLNFSRPRIVLVKCHSLQLEALCTRSGLATWPRFGAGRVDVTLWEWRELM